MFLYQIINLSWKYEKNDHDFLFAGCRCSKCGKESEASSKIEDFYELELNVKGLKNLDESLNDYLSIEELQGDNQYFCQACAMRADATRCIKLRSLPTVLNFQLKRCVFLPNVIGSILFHSHKVILTFADFFCYLYICRNFRKCCRLIFYDVFAVNNFFKVFPCSCLISAFLSSFWNCFMFLHCPWNCYKGLATFHLSMLY